MTTGRESTFYLPLRERVALRFLLEAHVPDLGAERAGLFGLLLLVRKPSLSRAELARAVFDAERTLAGESPAVVGNSLAAFCPPDEVDPADVASLMATRGVAFVADDTFEGLAWRGPDGFLSPDFQRACQDSLIAFDLPVFRERDELTDRVPRTIVRGTSDQVRALSAITADLGDRYAVDAYAGTGKTHLTLALFDTGRRFTYLTPWQAQREAFRRRAGRAGDEAVTLADLAARMARTFVRASGTRWTRAPRRQEATRTVAEQATMMGIPSIGRDTPEAVLSRALEAIRRWCGSEDRRIGYRHFHWPDHLPVAERASYVGWAVEAWEIMFALDERQERFGFPVRVYHLVKWLDLVGAGIPDMGTLLIDEAHDLPAPWLSLLRRYPGGYVVMGDPYQHLATGRTARPHDAKPLGMVESVRAGEQMMPLVRSVLRRHSEALMPDDIVGSRDRVTRHRLFGDNAIELPTAGLRVYGSLWSMLEQALRLKDAKVPYRFVEASAVQLVKATQDAIQLHMHGDRPRHYSLRGFATWTDFASHLVASGRSRVARLFERQFGHGNLQALMIGQAREGDALTLGLLEDAKNLEAGTVYMSPCCFSRPPGSRPTDGADVAVRAVYLAMTRVENELWLPYDWDDRLLDLAHQA
ncbi:hypothetical protein P3W24_06600 [Luteibacter sp. PPL201]|uniref:Helicase n=1 Tax=Luteibacter sahnii TaxID=3021977 RepID=A0ABT6B937_9GAMM